MLDNCLGGGEEILGRLRRKRMRPMGPISQVGYANAMPMPGLAQIQKLTNGFVVNYQRAMEVIPPTPSAHSAFPPDLKDSIKQIARAAIGKIAGEEWKDTNAPDQPVEPPKPEWVIEAAQMVCKTEDEMVAAIREAVVASTKIEQLYREGKLSNVASMHSF